jgi:cytochrome bd ubiquinol oxidase subunit I
MALTGVLAAAQGAAQALGPVDQEHLLWARELQAMSFAFHIPLVCFGVGFPAIVLFVEGLSLRTGDPSYRALAKRWSKAMTVLFAIGVVTGTILSFELGLLWPEFMSAFGQVFGVAFGLEGTSFFIEAIFIAIYVYGWERLPPRVHLLSGLPIVLTGITGSLMVISVNGWMNHPVGFDVTADGRVTNVRPWEAIFNPNFWHEFVHMYLAAFMVAGFVVAGIYAVSWLRGDRSRYVRAALAVPLTAAALAAPVQVLVGDWNGRTVADYQPTKLAAFEGLYHSERGAPIHVGGIYHDNKVKFGIPLPNLLSVLAKHDPNARIQGLEEVPPRDRPPVNTVRYAFQTMVGIGTLLAVLGVVFVLTWWRHGRLPRTPWFYRAVVAAGPAAVVALICGWVTTEVGRQPWVVYEFMRTDQAVTNAGGLPAVFFGMLIVYLGLAALAVWMIRRLAARPPEAELTDTEGAGWPRPA